MPVSFETAEEDVINSASPPKIFNPAPSFPEVIRMQGLIPAAVAFSFPPVMMISLGVMRHGFEEVTSNSASFI